MGEGLDFLLKNVILPILIAIITYLLVDRLGEWKVRRNNSMLGIAILDSLLQEARTGLSIMNSTYTNAQTQQTPFPVPNTLLPTASWSGMQTIPDQVLLRIIAISQRVTPHAFHPNTIRSCCKDYFDHMCKSYNGIIESGPDAVRQDFSTVFLMLLGEGPGQGKYLRAAQSVIETLEQTKELLDGNSTRWFPK